MSGKKKKDRYRLTFASRVLLWISMTDPIVIDKCLPRDRNIHQAYGISIILTSIFASLSGTYAAYVICENWMFSVIFGGLWGATIMTLDRMLIGAIKVSPDAASGTFLFSKVILPIITRLPLAIVIGITITIPIELIVFKDEIDFSFKSQERQEMDFIKEREKKLQEEELDIFHSAIQTSRKTISQKEKRKNELEKAQAAIISGLNNIKEQPTEFRRETTTNEDGSIEEKVIPIRLKPSSGIRLAEANYKRNEKELAEIDKTISYEERKIGNIQAHLDSAKLVLSEKYLKRVEAMEIEIPKGLVAQIETMETISTLEQNRVRFIIKWMIRCIIVFVEVMPILLKIFIPQTVHDVYIDAYKRVTENNILEKY